MLSSASGASFRPFVRDAAAHYDKAGRPARAAELRAWLDQNSAP
jgi:hypothetical protein